MNRTPSKAGGRESPIARQLEIVLSGTHVGTITNTPGDINVITIDEAYAADPAAPVLSFRAFRDPLTGAYRSSVRPTHTVVHPYFANLLPEGPLRGYLARHAGITPVRDFPLLWLLGNDLPGAVVLNDRDGIPIPPPDVAGSDRSPGPPPLLRFSLAGVQLKFSAAGDPQRGLTIPASGTGGHWIVKLPDQRFERVPENEFAMMTFARDVGIEVPEIALVQIGDLAGLPGDIRLAGNAYAIKRFDRTGDGGRIHTEDFAQANVLYPREKYERFNFDLLVEQVAQVMGTDAALEIIQRIVFTIGIGNGDMHAKNWSVRYVDGRTPTLAPAYDYVSTVVYLPDDDIGMNLAGSKRFMDVDEEHFARLAARARLPRKPVLDTVRTMVERMRERWPILAGSLTIDPAQRDRITAHMDRLPLFAARGGG